MTASLINLDDLYRGLHEHPELSFQEYKTAAIVEKELTILGYEVMSGIGGTGVVGIMRNGSGKTVLLRADMDGLPVKENTGLAYASKVHANDSKGNDVPVMHACGHDVHVTCLLGAARRLADDKTTWSGTLIVVFQPAEEVCTGARAMIDDGLFDKIPKPDVVLGQHVAPLPAGFIGIQPGYAFAAVDSLKITLYGRGGHGSRPEVTIDPVVLAASTIMKLQTVVSRVVSGTQTVVLTVGYVHAGTKENIISDFAELGLNIRTYDKDTRKTVIDAVHRIVDAEAVAAGATRMPEYEDLGSAPSVFNVPDATEKMRDVFGQKFGAAHVITPGPLTGSEDVGEFAVASGATCVYWLLGGSNPALFAKAKTADALMKVLESLPSNHSPMFAPVIQPTLDTGVEALVAAVHEWLPRK